ncbi:hypothetical protein EDB19DRAFT_555646 [Suillus lakei]|nr:hypothetical protein EDB19DRAFT_555646 [Suillus lakei]
MGSAFVLCTILFHAMASLYSTEVHFQDLGTCCMTEPCCAFKLYVTAGPRRLAEDQPLPEALRPTSFLMRVLCLLALGRPNLYDHWKSLQSEEAFETVRNKSCSILASTFTTASVLLATNGVFVSTGSPVPFFNYTSPASYCLLVMSLMLAMIAILTSGSSMIRWLHTDRYWTQEVSRVATLSCPTCC